MNQISNVQEEQTGVFSLPSPATPLTVATHVAAHAVIAVRQGQPPEHIMVEATPYDCVGQTKYWYDGSVLKLAAEQHIDSIELWRGSAIADCIEYLAGPIAEMRARGLSVDQLRLFGEHHDVGPVSFDRFDPSPCCRAVTDFSRTDYLVHWAFGGDPKSAFSMAWETSLTLVLEYWEDIERLAAVVAESYVLSGDQIVSLIGRDPVIDMGGYPTLTRLS